jgi:hypothetical protein
MRKLFLAAIVMAGLTNEAAVAAAPDLNTILMETTFQITGPSKSQPSAVSSGTGFIVGKGSSDGQTSYFVLVTAAHVFEEILGDIATINVRQKNPDGSYSTSAWNFSLRSNGVNLFVKHPSVDVAATYVQLPEAYTTIVHVAELLLTNDDDLSKYEIHPGDELFCLGYPLGASGPSGFPILRSGKIASYPLIPTKIHKTWWFDFRVFNGNSGGPVYLIDQSRNYGNNIKLGEKLQIMIGLVTQQVSADQGQGPRELQLGVVIPAPFIRETMDLLPAAPPSVQ